MAPALIRGAPVFSSPRVGTSGVRGTEDNGGAASQHRLDAVGLAGYRPKKNEASLAKNATSPIHNTEAERLADERGSGYSETHLRSSEWCRACKLRQIQQAEMFEFRRSRIII